MIPAAALAYALMDDEARANANRAHAGRRRGRGEHPVGIRNRTRAPRLGRRSVEEAAS
jgi:hypothetical protein